MDVVQCHRNEEHGKSVRYLYAGTEQRDGLKKKRKDELIGGLIGLAVSSSFGYNQIESPHTCSTVDNEDDINWISHP
jgi:hypothetical protein